MGLLKCPYALCKYKAILMDKLAVHIVRNHANDGNNFDSRKISEEAKLLTSKLLKKKLIKRKVILVCSSCSFETNLEAEIHDHMSENHQDVLEENAESSSDEEFQEEEDFPDDPLEEDEDEVEQPSHRLRKRKVRSKYTEDDEQFDKFEFENDSFENVKSENGEMPKYHCEPCGFRTPHRNIYIRHNKLIHSNEGDFVCTGCDKRFTKRRYLTTHKKYHCFSPNPASENADGSDQPESSMNRINRKHRWIGSTENVDGSDQPESSSLPIQEPEHPTMLVVDSAQMLKNMEEDDDDDLSFLDSNADESANLEETRNVDPPENQMEDRPNYLKKFVCKICEVEFYSIPELMSHTNEDHPDQPLVSESEIKIMYECQYCQFKSKFQSTLWRHVKALHAEQCNFACTECGQSFLTKRFLTIHINKNHDPTKVYSCQQCDFKSENRHYVYRHVKGVHLKERNHLCTECGKGFSNNAILMRHIRNVHLGQKDFLCDRCDRAFTDKRILDRHLATRHADDVIEKKGRFQCHLCDDFRTDYQRSLKRHVTTVHGHEKFDSENEVKFPLDVLLNADEDHQADVHNESLLE